MFAAKWVWIGKERDSLVFTSVRTRAGSFRFFCALCAGLTFFLLLLFLASATQAQEQDAPPPPPNSTIPLPPTAIAPVAPVNPPALQQDDSATVNPAALVGDDLANAEGIISIVHVDDFTNHHADRLYLLYTDEGETLSLLIDDAQLSAMGGAQAVEGKRVEVSYLRSLVADVALSPVQVAALKVLDEGVPGDESDALHAASETGVKTLRYANLLCQFPDMSTQLPPAHEFTDWSIGGLGTFDHYFQTISYGNLRIEFTTVSQWRALPVRNSDIASRKQWVDYVASTCPDLFTSEINLDDFDGVQFFTNGMQDAWGYGSSTAIVKYGGKVRIMPAAWYLYPAKQYDHGVVTHEIGHSLGQMHSNNYDGDDYEYDNFWDNMSGSDFGIRAGVDPCYSSSKWGIDRRLNCIADDMIAPHKLDQGWIAPSRIYTLNAGVDTTIQLDWLSLGGTMGNYSVIKIPVDEGNYFTVEARTNRTTSYDRMLPGTGVIIHEVIRNRYLPAWQVGATSDEESKSGGGVWLPGETYANTQWKFSVEVVAQTATGFTIRVRHTGTPPVWKPRIVLYNPAYSWGLGTFTTTLTVTNNGGLARNVQVSLDYVAKPFFDITNPPSPQTRLYTVHVEGATCSGDKPLICTLPDLGHQESRQLVLHLRATESAKFETTFVATSAAFTPTDDRHIVKMDAYLEAYPDLSVQIAPLNPTFVAGAGRMDATVTNRGETMPNVAFTITVPAAFAINSIQPTETALEATCEVVSPGVVCHSDSMAHNSSLRVRLQLQPSPGYTPGRYTVNAQANQLFKDSWDEVDEIDTSNNQIRGMICGGFCVPQGEDSSLIFLPRVGRR